MDAAQTNLKKFAFFLAIALLLTAPIPGLAQTFAVNTTSVQIGSSTCNDTQTVNVTSGSTTAIPFTVAVQYQGSTPNSGDQFGNWLFVRSQNAQLSTSIGTPFNDTTGTSGEVLTIGLNSSLLAAASDTATVVLTPNGGTAIPITVYYSQNTTCGGNTGSLTNNFVTVSPGNVALTAGQSGTSSQPLTLQNLTPNGMSFTYTLQPAGQWLSASQNSNTISGFGTTPITITGDGSKVPTTGTYTGSITLIPALGTTINVPVTFVVTSGGGGSTGTGTGTLTVNGATSNTASVSFTETGGVAPGGTCVPLQDTTAGVNQYSYQVSTTSGGNWLQANFGFSGSTQGSIAPTANACVTLTLANNVAVSLPSGIYQGSVALTSQSGSTATINATLFVSGGTPAGISVSPGVVYTFPNAASSSPNLEAQVFAITASSGYNLGTAGISSSAGCGSSTWLTISTPTASGNTETFTATANPSGLGTGLYCATVTMINTGTQSGTTTILLVLPVNQGTGGGGGSTGGGTGTSLALPSNLSFQEQAGNLFFNNQKEAQNVTITGPQGTAWSANIIYGNQGSGWLQFDSPAQGQGTFGNGPSTLVVDLAPAAANLAPTSTVYNATVQITTTLGTSSVAVTLLVTPTTTPVLLGLPAVSTFAVATGSSTPSQTVQVVGSDNPTSPSSPTITLGTPTATWISATPTGNTMSISVSPAGQATGAYYGTVSVSAPAYQNPLVYPVVMVVNGGGGGSSSGPLTLSSSSLTYTNVTSQISQTLNVTANSSMNTNVTAAEATCQNQTWLGISPSGSLTVGTSSTPISVTVTPNGISNGTTCIGTITLATSSATQTVNVSMTVGAVGGSGNVTVSPTSMTFAYTQQQTIPPAQTATIVNATSGTAGIPFTVTPSPVNSWLQISTTNGTTPYNSPGLSISVAPGNMSAGNYQGTVTIAPNGGTAQVINVTMTITSTATVTATPTTLALAYTAGGTSPTSTIQVSGGGATAGFTASVTTGATWLQVTPTTGTTPNSGTTNLTVSLVSSALATLTPASSPYTGTITVAGTSPATGTTNINVTLTVTAALPAITGVTNSGSGATGAVSPGELISIFANAANPIGPSVPVSLSNTTCPSPCTSVPTTMGGVQVKFLPSSILAPLIYVGPGQINAVVPYQVAGVANISVEVIYLGQTSNAYPLTTAVTAPGIFTANGTGTGQAAIAQYDNTGKYQGTNSASNAAKAGWVLSVYMTGEGVVTPAAATGSVTVATSTPPYLPQPLYVPNVTIGGQPVSLGGYGDANGLVSGVLQINAVVPTGAGTGAVPLTVSIGPNSAQQGVTVYLQ